MQKQFKGWTNKSIIMPRPEFIGLPWKSNHKFMCSDNDEKIKFLKKIGVKCNHCKRTIDFDGKEITAKTWGFVEVECSSCNEVAKVSCYADDELR